MKLGYTLFASAITMPVLAALLLEKTPSGRAATTARWLGALVGGGLHLCALIGQPLVKHPVIWGVFATFATLATFLGFDRKKS